MAIDWHHIRTRRFLPMTPPPDWPSAVQPLSIEGVSLLGIDPTTNKLYWDGKPIVVRDRVRLGLWELILVLYRKAESLSKRTKQIIPREFARVAANLDEFCGEENFEKARISIDWINTCLKNFTKDYKLGFCSRNKNYFCAVFPQSEGCLQSQ